MIGSRQGWIEVPYVDCPADTGGHGSAGLRTTPGGEMAIVPGLVHRDGDGVPDVLRGEETQIVGAVPDEGILAVVPPGTHSKWVRVESGRIVSFATFMTGELFALLVQHSILGRAGGPAGRRSHAAPPGVRRRRCARVGLRRTHARECPRRGPGACSASLPPRTSATGFPAC